MFKKFTKENLSNQNLVKSSVARGIRSSILEQYPSLEPYFEDILPKKGALVVVKCDNHVNLITINKDILFYNERDGPYFPTLRLFHKYPFCLPKVQVDTGAIKFVLNGSNIMCPGLTSKGGRLDEDFPAGKAIFAEGKEHCMAIGLSKMSRTEIKTKNSDIGINLSHYVNDGLWHMPALD